MDLFDQVSEDIKTAMKAKDKVALETLRNIKKFFLEENEKWIVYVTDERASKIINSVDKYNTEAEAIEDFIERLRADKVLREL